MNKKTGIIIGILVLFAAILFFGDKNLKEDNVVIYFPIDNDFPNTDQGKITFEFRFPKNAFKVGDKTADTLMFLDSSTIPDLKITYNQLDRRVHAGIPLLTAEDVILLDGKTHKLEYEFNRDQRKQSIFLDDNLLATGEFTGELSAFAGYVIYEQSKFIESPIPIEVSFE